MWHPTEATAGLANAAEILGDVRELSLQLGPRRRLDIGDGQPAWTEVNSVPALRDWVEHYSAESLAAREWPVIIRAWELARTSKARELLALDREWGASARQAPFSEASFRVGRRQLNKLRGLRHERVIARYLQAIDAGEASGWHPIVFGIVLAVYHVPLRSGLLQFASQTLTGMVTAAERGGRLPERACQQVLDAAIAALPSRMPPLPEPGICGAE
jgi:urease accessory protein UreF